MPKTHPILFSGPMVRALLQGRKQQTRRIVKLPSPSEGWHVNNCPYGQPGMSLLWVRETFASIHLTGAPCVVYQATDQRAWKYKPSIHMPRCASRLTLELTDVRVQRLQDISRGDAMDEGCPFSNMAQGDDPRKWYADLWNSINGAGSWDVNPFVWRLSFRVHQQNVDALLKARTA